jgi:hypothetical protein
MFPKNSSRFIKEYGRNMREMVILLSNQLSQLPLFGKLRRCYLHLLFYNYRHLLQRRTHLVILRRKCLWYSHTLFPDLVHPVAAVPASLDYGDDYKLEKDDKTILIWAAYKGHEANVRLLLEHGADVNQASDDGRTPLICAAGAGHEHIVRLLLEHGAEVNKADVYRKTPLICATAAGHGPIAQLLLKHGADVDQAGNNSRAPLVRAVSAGLEAYLLDPRDSWGSSEIPGPSTAIRQFEPQSDSFPKAVALPD